MKYIESVKLKFVRKQFWMYKIGDNLIGTIALLRWSEINSLQAYFFLAVIFKKDNVINS